MKKLENFYCGHLTLLRKNLLLGQFGNLAATNVEEYGQGFKNSYLPTLSVDRHQGLQVWDEVTNYGPQMYWVARKALEGYCQEEPEISKTTITTITRFAIALLKVAVEVDLGSSSQGSA